MSANVPNGLKPAAAVAAAPGNVRMEQSLSQSRQEGFLARILARFNASGEFERDVELEAYANWKEQLQRRER